MQAGFSPGVSVCVLEAESGEAMLTYSARRPRDPESSRAGSLCWTGP